MQMCVHVSHSVVSDSLWPHGLYPARLLYGISQARILEWVAIFFSKDMAGGGVKKHAWQVQPGVQGMAGPCHRASTKVS